MVRQETLETTECVSRRQRCIIQGTTVYRWGDKTDALWCKGRQERSIFIRIIATALMTDRQVSPEHLQCAQDHPSVCISKPSYHRIGSLFYWSIREAHFDHSQTLPIPTHRHWCHMRDVHTHANTVYHTVSRLKPNLFNLFFFWNPTVCCCDFILISDVGRGKSLCSPYTITRSLWLMLLPQEREH